MDYKSQIKNYINDEIKILQNLDIEELNKTINLLEETRLKGNTIYVFGNGGSASTASHMQNDFNKGISEKLVKRYKFNCLCDNVATIMAIANDDCYENVFLNQITNNVKPGDIAIAISGSGNSKNVINAVEYFKSKGNTVIGFTGYSGGKLKELADIKLHVPLDNMQITEDVHIIFNHLMMYILCHTIKE